ncbi:MAG TPA: peptidylprolyl isomerase [Armatimonadaceae bacterium]|nr:peptidylprolyl isomerase [Armatimonadaceae bacterium]
MSLMAINRGFKKYGTVLGAILAFILIVGVVLSGMGSNLGGGGGGPMSPEAAEGETVATVGDAKVSQAQLDRIVDNLMQQQAMFGQSARPQPAEVPGLRLRALDSIKEQQAVLAAAAANGVRIGASEINATREKAWQQLRARYAETLGLKADASDADINVALNKQNPGLTVSVLKQQALPDEAVRIQAAAEGLEAKFRQDIKPTESEVRQGLSDMKVRHILVKFGEGALPEAQAKAKAEKLLAAVKADPSKMGDLAKQNTDDPGSKATGGVYDWPPDQRANIVPEFKDALKKLKPEETYPELVRVVNPGYSGFHIIRLEDVKQGASFPKDFEKEKQKYIEEYASAAARDKVNAAVMAALPSVKVEVTDPLMIAARSLQEASTVTDKTAREAKLNAALADLGKVKKEDDPQGIAPSMKAMIYSQMDKSAEAVAAFKEALTYRNSVETRLALAGLLAKQKDTAGVKAQLAEVEKLAVTEPMLYFQIGSLYDQIGDKAKGEAARKKAGELFERMQQLNAANMPPATGTAPPPTSPAAPPKPAAK